MKSHFFAYISRMRFISRWALMRNTAPENVQEHSHQVAVLAHVFLHSLKVLNLKHVHYFSTPPLFCKNVLPNFLRN